MRPWWWVRLQAASPRELLWRATPGSPARDCPPGPAPAWPWTPPSIAAHPVPLSLFAAPPDDLAPTRPGGPWRGDPKPLWDAHRLWRLLAGPQSSWHGPIDRWWRTHRAPSVLWASTHAVASRLPALLAAGHRHAAWAHADHLHRYPSRFSSQGNHRVAELAALWLTRAALPDAPWPCDELPDVLDAQLHPDGWPREQSLAYLAHILEWGALALRAIPSHAGLRAPLAKGLAPLLAVLSSGGGAPHIGDDGGDEVLPGDASYVHDVAGCVARLLDVPGPAGWQPGRRAAWMGLAPGRHGAAEPAPSTVFPDGGMTLLSTPRSQLLFDHGPLGLAPLAAHGHADALAVWFVLDGEPVWGSRGSSTYHEPLVRERERGSASQSTVMVAGRSSARPHDHPFLWATQARATLEHVRLGAVGGEVAAWHDGWRDSLGVVPHRHVQLDAGCLRITDHLHGAGRHRVERRWHLAPGVDARQEGHRVRLLTPRGTRLWLEAALPVRLETTPHAVGYGRTTDATTVVETLPQTLPAVCRTTVRWALSAHEEPGTRHGP